MIRPSPEPLFFGPHERPLFGWLHRASRSAKVGVVLCNAFGYEAVCAHRSFRHFADAIAGAGAPVLRFDYDGTGDSAGSDSDPARLRAWVKSVHSAMDKLGAAADVEQVVLVGLRLGALIAALAAEEREDCAAFVAIAPVISGKAYLRELRALQMTLALKDPPSGVAPRDSEVQEAVGFRISADTKAEIGEVDLTRRERAPSASVLVLDRDDLAPTAAWHEKLTLLGASVTTRSVGGYVDMVADPHKTIVPEALMSELVSWLEPRIDPEGMASPHSSPRAFPLRPFELAQGVTEEPVFVEAQPPLFGVKSSPSAIPRSGRAILLLNAGASHHVGPNRLYTTLARRWAALGHLVLRFDGSGLGDSPVRVGQIENAVYPPCALDDVRSAVAYLRQERGITHCDVIGVCSGAYHGFKAAAAGIPVSAVVAINPLTFSWGPDEAHATPKFHVASEARRYTEAAGRTESWKKLLRGQVRLDAVAKVAVRHGAAFAKDRLRDMARRFQLPIEQDLGSELQSIASRRIPLHLVVASGDPGLALLTQGGGSVTERLRGTGALTVDTIEGSDHTFTALWTHELLAELLDRYVGSPPT